MSTAHHPLSRLAVLLALLASGIACGSSTSPSGGGSIGTSTAGSPTIVAATIDGTAFTANTATATARNNILAVSGTSGSGSNVTTLAFATTTTVGTSRIAPGTGVNATYQTLSGTSSSGWSASDNQGSGSVTVNTLTSTRASGTFSFVLAPASGAAAGPKSVLAGTFDVPVSQ